MKVSQFAIIGAMLMVPVYADMQQNQDYINGKEALNAGIPEVAVKRLSSVLNDTSLTPDEQRDVLLLLCEAQVRARLGKKAEETLQNELLLDHPDRLFWIAQSYVAQGRRKDASLEFEKLLDIPGHVRAKDSLSALVELYRSLRQEEKAFSLLENAHSNNQLELRGKIQLAEIYLQKGEPVKSRVIIDSLKEEAVNTIPVIYLNARLDLAEGKLDAAGEKFSEIIKSETGNVGYKEISRLGLADSIARSGNYSEAVKLLTDIAEKDGNSPSLAPIFDRLLDWVKRLEDTEELEILLKVWIKRPDPVSDAEGDVRIELDDRDAFAHYLYASILSRSEEQKDLEQSQNLLEYLRVGQPQHTMVSKSWFLTAENMLKLEDLQGAKEVLIKLSEDGRTDREKQQAKTLIGMIQEEQGMIEESLETFRSISEEDNIYSDLARVNTAMMELERGNLLAFQTATNSVKDQTLRNGLLYEEVIAKVMHKQELADQRLLELVKNVDHPLRSEARWVLIRSHLDRETLDEKMISQQIEILKTENISGEQKERLAKIELRFLIETKKWDQIVTLYEELKESKELSADKLAVLMGEAYYRNGDFNKARREFNIVIQEYGDSVYLEYAYFYSGLAARREGTPQSKEEALSLLQSAIELNGSFQVEAVVQKARILIDQNKFDQARDELTERISLVEDPSYKANLNLLLGEVYYQKAGEEKEGVAIFKQAESCFIQTLEYYKDDPVWSSRIYFLLGQTREKIDPTLTRALDTYFIVVNLENTKDKNRPQEWEWYYKCGLRSVVLLENAERWKAAANLLEKMASTFGPKSGALSERAGKIRLKHHIW